MSTLLGQCDTKTFHRHLVLMFDGTGNKRLNLSNVARFFEAIDDSDPKHYEPYTKVGPGVSGVKPLEPEDQPQQVLKYIKGVGTDVLGHFSGLGFGYGLSANVIAGYVWLSNEYRDGDEIFVFGFSRGAFSARSLVSLVHRCGGVLKKESIADEKNQELEESSQVVVKAYDMYKAYVQTTTVDGKEKQDPALNKAFYNARQEFTTTATKDNFRIQHVKIKMLGVWDTVGAVGIDTGIKILDNYVYPFCRYGSKRYQFHDQSLPCIVENAYHALALDEHRSHFSPTLWDAVTAKEQKVKQVWFVGSHCNVGGGADLDDLDDPDDLWQYSYVWMQKQAMEHGLRFYWTHESPPTQTSSSEGPPLPTRRVSLRQPEDSYRRFFGGCYQWLSPWFIRKVIETNGARLHWSVPDRTALSLKFPEKIPYFPDALFGPKGSPIKRVAPDMVEIHKQDSKTPGLVKKTLWQIETDDTKVKSEHRLPLVQCGCKDPVPAPVKQTGFWSWFRFGFGGRWEQLGKGLEYTE